MKRSIFGIAALLALASFALCAPARAQNVTTYVDGGQKVVVTPLKGLPTQAQGIDSSSNLPCIIGLSLTCEMPTTVHATGTFNDAAVGATGSAVPGFAGLSGVNIGGTMQGWTGANPSGSVYAGSVVIANPATIYSAQATVTTSAAALTAHALFNGIVLTALSTNSAAIYVGPSGVTTSTGYPLQPGASISYGVTNTSAVYIISAASTTDKISETGN